MADFSVGGAAGAGFGLIGRKPLAVLAWGVVTWLFLIGPAIFVASQILTTIGPLIAQAEAIRTTSGGKAPAGPPPEFMQAYMAMMSRIFLLQPVLLIGSLLVRSVVTSAVCRAVLEPEDSAYAYMRLGMRELWVFLVSFVFALIVGCTAIGLMIPLSIFVGVSAIANSPILTSVVIVAAFSVMMGVLIWLSLRLYLGVPMSFDENEFRLFEAWNFSRGHVGKMVALGLIQIAIAVVLEIVIVILIAVIGVAAVQAAGLTTPDQLRTFLQHPPTHWTPMAIALVTVGSLLLGIISALAVSIFLAPWVEAYRQLRDSGARGTPHYQPSLGEAQPAVAPSP